MYWYFGIHSLINDMLVGNDFFVFMFLIFFLNTIIQSPFFGQTFSRALVLSPTGLFHILYSL